MIKIAPMLIYGQPIEKSYPEPGQWPWDLVLRYGASKFVQMMILG